MRCFHVLVHGTLDWSLADTGEDFRPGGFYCHRHVLASSEHEASKIAFQRVRSNLDRSFGWLSSGRAALRLEAEEIRAAPLHKLFVPDNRGHSFYEQD